MTKTKHIPKLRFPEFNSEWRVEALGNVTKWSSGGTPAKDTPSYWGGDIPWISASSMYGSDFSTSDRTLTEIGVKHGSKIAKRGSILLLVRGSMLFNTIPVGFAGRNVAFNQDVKAIASEELNHQYLFYFFKASEHKLLSMVVGTGIGAGKLDLDDLLKMKITVPAMEEQLKIAESLEVVDNRVAVVGKKVELLKQYKKGAMQKIFTQQLRFKKNNGKGYTAWREVGFEDALTSLATKQYQIQSSKYSDSGIYPVVDQGQKEIIGYSNASERVFEGIPVIVFGDHTTFLKYVDYKFIVGADGTKLLSSNAGNNLKYLYFYLQQNHLEPEGYKRHFSNLKQIRILLPETEEQQKIADFLTTLDDKIKAEESMLEQARAFKKYLLQRMFV